MGPSRDGRTAQSRSRPMSGSRTVLTPGSDHTVRPFRAHLRPTSCESVPKWARIQNILNLRRRESEFVPRFSSEDRGQEEEYRPCGRQEDKQVQHANAARRDGDTRGHRVPELPAERRSQWHSLIVLSRRPLAAGHVDELLRSNEEPPTRDAQGKKSGQNERDPIEREVGQAARGKHTLDFPEESGCTNYDVAEELLDSVAVGGRSAHAG
jgi:hypothetical protein